MLETIQLCAKKKKAQACLRILSPKCVCKLNIFNIYKQDLALNNIQWLICH